MSMMPFVLIAEQIDDGLRLSVLIVRVKSLPIENQSLMTMIDSLLPVQNADINSKDQIFVVSLIKKA